MHLLLTNLPHKLKYVSAAINPNSICCLKYSLQDWGPACHMWESGSHQSPTRLPHQDAAAWPPQQPFPLPPCQQLPRHQPSCLSSPGILQNPRNWKRCLSGNEKPFLFVSLWQWPHILGPRSLCWSPRDHLPLPGGESAGTVSRIRLVVGHNLLYVNYRCKS